jgi:NADPH:quinone reductase-like Zn-dependent oxidoreductase
MDSGSAREAPEPGEADGLAVGGDADRGWRDGVWRGGPYDVVLDLAGRGSFAEARRLLTPRGCLVTGARPAAALLSVVSRRVRVAGPVPKVGDLLYLRDLLDEGRLQVAVDRTCPLDEIAAAHERRETADPRGSVVVRIS